MRRIAFLLLISGLGVAPLAHAQNHAEVGAFVDYFKLGETSSNFVGFGGRAAFNVARNVQIEAEMAYDFNRVFTEGFTDNTSGTITTTNSNLRVLHGLFGPKFQTSGPVRVFVTVKGGFTNFRFDPTPASFDTFTSSVTNLRTSNVDAALYPGGGVEAFLGPIGLRLEVGDEIIFANGARNNWKVTFGPQIRF
jgi:Outer membrane protein beta-barrel domain